MRAQGFGRDPARGSRVFGRGALGEKGNEPCQQIFTAGRCAGGWPTGAIQRAVRHGVPPSRRFQRNDKPDAFMGRARPRRSAWGGRSHEPSWSSRGAQRPSDPAGIAAGLPHPPSRARNDKPQVFMSIVATKHSTELDRYARASRARSDKQESNFWASITLLIFAQKNVPEKCHVLRAYYVTLPLRIRFFLAMNLTE